MIGPIRIALQVSVFLILSMVLTLPAAAATLTITITGPNSGNVSARPTSGNGGGLCFGTLPGPVTCNIEFTDGTTVKVMANSPSVPGLVSAGTGSASSCPATSTCTFVINANSSLNVQFSTANNALRRSIQIDLLGAAGEVGVDHNNCQDWELSATGCPSQYIAGSEVRLEGRNVPGSLFVGFSAGIADAAGCSASPCTFVLNTNSSVSATFATLASVVLNPPSATAQVNDQRFFAATGTFDNAGTRALNAGPGFWSSRRSMSEARFSLAADVIDNRLYAVAGIINDGDGPGVKLERYDPAVGDLGCCDAWNTTLNPPVALANLPTPREGLAVAALSGRLYALGGHTSGSVTTAVVESYDPATNTWTSRAPLSKARNGLAAAVVGSTLYAVGGDGNAFTDPTLTTGATPVKAVHISELRAAINTLRSQAGLGVFGFADPELSAGSSRIMAAHISELRTALNAVYDAVATPLPVYTESLTAGATIIKAIHINELRSAANLPLNTLESYDPVANSWTTLTGMPTARTGLAAAAVNGQLYAIGGFRGGTNVATVEVYDPGTGVWQTRSPMPTPRTALEAVTINGLIYVVGGYSNAPLGTVEVYNPATDTWTTLGSMPTARAFFGLAAFDGRLWAVGGQGGAGTKLATVESFRPPEHTWWSSMPSVATISDQGNATPLSAGQTTIIGRSVGISCLSSSCATLTVTAGSEAPPRSISGVSRGRQ
jgi:N-acetylneuraminic acid mutarotase